MDRANLSLARAANQNQMVKDLRLDIGQRYSIATLAFFIPYIILEVPVSFTAKAALTRIVSGRLALVRCEDLAWRRHPPLGRYDAGYVPPSPTVVTTNPQQWAL